MKKLLSVLLSALLVITLFIPASALAETTLTVWCWDPAFNIYAINEAAKIYKEINPDVTVNVVETSSDDCKIKLTVALSSGDTSTLPDIILVQDNDGRKNLNTFPGSFYPMPADKVAFEDFAAYKLKHFAYEGVQYGVPFDNGAAAMFLRTDYLEATGYSMADVTDITWDQLIEIGLKVKETTGHALISVQAGYGDLIMLMLQSAGSWFFDAEGNPTIASNPVVKDAVETVVKLRQSGIVQEGADWTEYIASFNNGSTAGTIQGCWILGSVVLGEGQEGKWGMTNVPRLNAEGATNYSSAGGSSWMIPATSPNAEVALDFLSKTFGASVDFYQTILQSSGAIATYLPAAGGPAYAEPHPYFNGQKVFEDLMTYSSKIPQVEYGMFNYEARDAVVVAVEDVMNGADVDTALQTAQDQVQFLMEE